jgi:hypothetical protein
MKLFSIFTSIIIFVTVSKLNGSQNNKGNFDNDLGLSFCILLKVLSLKVILDALIIAMVHLRRQLIAN